MKSPLIAVLALLTCTVCGTQEKPPSLEICSARVHLGMTKAEVETTASGSMIVGGKGDYWVITTGDPAKGAANSLNQNGANVCVISHDTVSSPGSPFERAVFECGTRRLLIVKGKVDGQMIEDMYESIGNTK
jgi:hypothetical protein